MQILNNLSVIEFDNDEELNRLLELIESGTFFVIVDGVLSQVNLNL